MARQHEEILRLGFGGSSNVTAMMESIQYAKTNFNVCELHIFRFHVSETDPVFIELRKLLLDDDTTGKGERKRHGEEKQDESILLPQNKQQVQQEKKQQPRRKWKNVIMSRCYGQVDLLLEAILSCSNVCCLKITPPRGATIDVEELAPGTEPYIDALSGLFSRQSEKKEDTIIKSSLDSLQFRSMVFTSSQIQRLLLMKNESIAEGNVVMVDKNDDDDEDDDNHAESVANKGGFGDVETVNTSDNDTRMCIESIVGGITDSTDSTGTSGTTGTTTTTTFTHLTFLKEISFARCKFLDNSHRTLGEGLAQGRKLCNGARSSSSPTMYSSSSSPMSSVLISPASLAFRYCDLNDEQLAELLHYLIGIPTLQKLCLLFKKDVYLTHTMKAVCRILQHSSDENFGIGGTGVDDHENESLPNLPADVTNNVMDVDGDETKRTLRNHNADGEDTTGNEIGPGKDDRNHINVQNDDHHHKENYCNSSNNGRSSLIQLELAAKNISLEGLSYLTQGLASNRSLEVLLLRVWNWPMAPEDDTTVQEHSQQGQEQGQVLDGGDSTLVSMPPLPETDNVTSSSMANFVERSFCHEGCNVSLLSIYCKPSHVMLKEISQRLLWMPQLKKLNITGGLEKRYIQHVVDTYLIPALKQPPIRRTVPLYDNDDDDDSNNHDRNDNNLSPENDKNNNFGLEDIFLSFSLQPESLEMIQFYCDLNKSGGRFFLQNGSQNERNNNRRNVRTTTMSVQPLTISNFVTSATGTENTSAVAADALLWPLLFSRVLHDTCSSSSLSPTIFNRNETSEEARLWPYGLIQTYTGAATISASTANENVIDDNHPDDAQALTIQVGSTTTRRRIGDDWQIQEGRGAKAAAAAADRRRRRLGVIYYLLVNGAMVDITSNQVFTE